MRSRPPNPFVVGNSVGGTSAFVGRSHILQRVAATLSQPLQPGIVLFGQRRIGKTSILCELLVWLPTQGPWQPVFFDLHQYAGKSVADIVSALAAAIAFSCDRSPPVLGADAVSRFRDHWLPFILSTLPADSRLIFLFDEFDVVADPKAQAAHVDLFRFLNELFEEPRLRLRIGAVYAMGRGIDDLDIAVRPLLRSVTTQPVSTMSRGEFDQLLDLATKVSEIQWQPAARAEIWRLTSGHPMLTQLIASSTWNDLPEGTRSIEVAHVQGIIPQVLTETQNILSWLWEGLTPACRIVASALAARGAETVTLDDLEKLLRESGVRMVVSQLQAAPRLMCEWDVLEEKAGKYRFKVELVRRWIEKNRRFSDVRLYLDQLDPQADLLYKQASERWKCSQTSEDTVVVKRMLELILDTKMNPNHVGAALLLAEVHLSQDNLEEAISVVERLYPSQPAAVRPMYVKLLNQKLDGLDPGDERDRLAVLEKILVIAPGERTAVLGRQAIWRERGLRARQAGDLMEALAEFQRAECLDLALEVEAEIQRQQGALVLRALQVLEKAEQYEKAMQLLEVNRELLRDLNPADYDTIIMRLREGQNKIMCYQQAVHAASKGERDGAVKYFIQVIQIDPYYRDAAQRLQALVRRSGITGIMSAALAWGLCGVLFVALVMQHRYSQASEMVCPEPSPTKVCPAPAPHPAWAVGPPAEVAGAKQTITRPASGGMTTAPTELSPASKTTSVPPEQIASASAVESSKLDDTRGPPRTTTEKKGAKSVLAAKAESLRRTMKEHAAIGEALLATYCQVPTSEFVPTDATIKLRFELEADGTIRDVDLDSLSLGLSLLERSCVKKLIGDSSRFNFGRASDFETVYYHTFSFRPKP